MSVLIANDTHGEYEWKTSRIRRLLQSSSNIKGNKKFKTLNSKSFFKKHSFLSMTIKTPIKKDFLLHLELRVNKPERVFGLLVRCRELDIFKILGILGAFFGHSLGNLWEFFGDVCFRGSKCVGVDLGNLT